MTRKTSKTSKASKTNKKPPEKLSRATAQDILSLNRIRTNIIHILLQTTGPLNKKTLEELRRMDARDLATCTAIAILASKRTLDNMRSKLKMRR